MAKRKKKRKIVNYGIGFGTLWLLVLGLLLLLGGIFDWNFVLTSTPEGIGISILIGTLFATGFWSLKLITKN